MHIPTGKSLSEFARFIFGHFTTQSMSARTYCIKKILHKHYMYRVSDILLSTRVYLFDIWVLSEPLKKSIDLRFFENCILFFEKISALQHYDFVYSLCSIVSIFIHTFGGRIVLFVPAVVIELLHVVLFPIIPIPPVIPLLSFSILNPMGGTSDSNEAS